MTESAELAGDRIVATYDLHDTERSPDALAAAIALEQTVEVPQALADTADLPPGVVGEVERIDIGAGAEGAARAMLSYDPAVVEAGGVPALINLVFGNVSMMPGVRLVDLSFPDHVLAGLAGPRHGVAGVRALTGVYGRPLLATALKPRGVPVSRLVEMAGAFARGGGDIVKDDQNLIDEFETFKDRVKRCADAVDGANQHTGRRCLYLPYVTGPLPALTRRFEYVARLGLPGVLASPFIAGLGIPRSLARDHDLMLMAHPTFSGGHFVSRREGIDHGLLFGTLLRIAGADVAVFPNVGGRFQFTRDDCAGIAARLRAPLGRLLPAWPCPAGGMSFEQLPGMCADYGPDAVLLIGGALIGHGEGPRSEHPLVRGHHPRHLGGERLEPPRLAPRAAPRYRRAAGAGASSRIRMERPAELALQGRARSRDRTWPSRGCAGSSSSARFGERSRTDLRYFEIAAGWILESREAPAYAHRDRGARPRRARPREPSGNAGADGRRQHRAARGPPVAQRIVRAVRILLHRRSRPGPAHGPVSIAISPPRRSRGKRERSFNDE